MEFCVASKSDNKSTEAIITFTASGLIRLVVQDSFDQQTGNYIDLTKEDFLDLFETAKAYMDKKGI